MFTGIVQFIYKIVILIDKKQVYLYADDKFLKTISIGDSVSIDGICLTVVKIYNDYCTFDISDETISKTILLYYTEKLANVELAIQVGSFLGGHIMLGHVHQICTLVSLLDNGDMWLDLHTEANNVTTYKGCISVNGVSLTVAEINGSMIRISLIPETLYKTNFKYASPGDKFNIEFDIHSSKYEIHDDSYYMRQAIIEGNKGRITAPPNPWVGCIIVKHNKIIGRGYHKKAGEPHAEVNAINSSNMSVEDSTLYVTLEPCCHYGRTPPCTDLLIKNKIKRVIVGIVDPDNRVAGKGIEQLRSAGIEVILIQTINPQVFDEVKYNLRQYIHHRKTGLPYLTLKIALSLDNCYRDSNGISKWITHEESRKEGHILRSMCQAIIVGSNTVQQDNPELNVRYNIPIIDQPKIIVIDGESLIPSNKKILNDRTTIITTDRLSNKWPSNINKIVMSHNYLMSDLIKNINHMHCLIEGGSKIQQSFCKEGLVNEIVIFRSTKIFGPNAYQWFAIVPNMKLSLIESKIISNGNDNNIMERYIVDYDQTIPKNINTDIIFDNIDNTIDHFANGGMVLVMDDVSRENEGDLMVAASMITETQITEMINHTTGIICVPMERARAKKLNLPLMCLENTDTLKTAFTVSVDYYKTGTGVSSNDRLLTVRSLADEETLSTDLRRPGHIFPLIAHPKGLSARHGHTEASIALCKLANVYPRVAVIGELQNKDGSMSRGQQCYNYAKSNNIPMIAVQQLVELTEKLTEPKLLTHCNISSDIGELEWKFLCFDSGNYNYPHKVFIYPHNFNNNENEIIPIRIHSECFTGDVFKSKHCDCGLQLDASMKYITNYGKGIIIFPSEHEGRGIGITNKVKAYKLQQKCKLNTLDANNALGLDIDARTYDDILGILEQLKISKVELLTENPHKIDALSDIIVKSTPILTETNAHNEKYLQIKKEHFEKINNISLPLVKGHEPIIDISTYDKSSLKIALVYAMWHSYYIDQMRDKLKSYLNEFGITNISEFAVPGSNEVPFKASKIASDFDGIICIGILIKGDTLHFENVSGAVSDGIMQAQIKTGVPIMNCILSCLTMEQAVDRITGPKSTLEYIARSLIKMICD